MVVAKITVLLGSAMVVTLRVGGGNSGWDM